MLREDGHLYANGQRVETPSITVEEGDVVASLHSIEWQGKGSFQGIAFDHIEMCVYVNGDGQSATINAIKGPVFPAVYGWHF